MARNRKFNKGDKVRYQSKEWIVCEGGRSCPTRKSFMYKIARGAWKREVAGNSLEVL